MVDRWIVFGGWGVAPDILQPLFGKNSVLIDSTGIAPLLVHDEILAPDWTDILAEQIKHQLPGTPFCIAGWSMGAIMAWALAKIVCPAGVVCISATPSFCRRPGFSHGQHPSMLRTMRKKIAEQPAAVLEDFGEECGLTGNNQSIYQAGLPVSSLIAGLQFLEQASLFPLEKPYFSTLFLHGNRDSIIPYGAGRYFSEQTGGAFEEFDGPHVFFTDHYDVLRKCIELFAMDCTR
jgi:surfactin synthase thioesterase subunit